MPRAIADRQPVRWWGFAMTIAVLAVAASFNALWNDFTYDDRFIVLGNDLVHDVRRAWRLFVLPYWPIRYGGDGYRPLTLVAFAAQWAAAPGSPMLFHAVTIILYAIACIAAFWLASLLLPRPYAWLAAALFAVHPVHVEAFASVVGQAEIWVGILLLGLTAFYVHCRRTSAFGPRQAVPIVALYFTVCLFKEHAITLPFLLIAAEVLLVGSRRPLSQRMREQRPFYLVLALTACLFVAFRTLVIGDVRGFSPFVPFVSLGVGSTGRFLTMLGVVPDWMRLIFWPARLSTEYAPPAYDVTNSPAWSQLPGLLILVGVLGLAVLTARRKPVVSFGIAWFVITLLPASNFVVATGVLVAERTLFTPSFGAMLAVCAALPGLARHVQSSVTRVAVLAGVQTVLLLGIAKSIVQSAAWRDNESLFIADIAANPGVYRSHYMLGSWYMAREDYARGERAYLAALALFPHDPFVAYNLGQMYFAAGSYDRAYAMYARANKILPGFQDVLTRMALTRAMQERFAEARVLAEQAMRHDAADLRTLRPILVAASLKQRGRDRLVKDFAAAPVSPIPR